MRDNNFSELNGFENINKDFPKLNHLDLSGNKFSCGKLQLIVDSLETQEVTVGKTVDIDGDVNNYKEVTCV